MRSLMGIVNDPSSSVDHLHGISVDALNLCFSFHGLGWVELVDQRLKCRFLTCFIDDRFVGFSRKWRNLALHGVEFSPDGE